VQFSLSLRIHAMPASLWPALLCHISTLLHIHPPPHASQTIVSQFNHSTAQRQLNSAIDNTQKRRVKKRNMDSRHSRGSIAVHLDDGDIKTCSRVTATASSCRSKASSFTGSGSSLGLFSPRRRFDLSYVFLIWLCISLALSATHVQAQDQVDPPNRVTRPNQFDMYFGKTPFSVCACRLCVDLKGKIMVDAAYLVYVANTKRRDC